MKKSFLCYCVPVILHSSCWSCATMFVLCKVWFWRLFCEFCWCKTRYRHQDNISWRTRGTFLEIINMSQAKVPLKFYSEFIQCKIWFVWVINKTKIIESVFLLQNVTFTVFAVSLFVEFTSNISYLFIWSYIISVRYPAVIAYLKHIICLWDKKIFFQ